MFNQNLVFSVMNTLFNYSRKIMMVGSGWRCLVWFQSWVGERALKGRSPGLEACQSGIEFHFAQGT